MCNTFSETNAADYRQFLPPQCAASLFLSPVTETEIIDIVQSFKSTNSCGVDNINPCVIKKIIHYISRTLIHVFNILYLQV